MKGCCYKKHEKNAQRLEQAARRAHHWVQSVWESEVNGEPVVTPVLVATKSARRVAQRAKKMERQQQELMKERRTGT
eukprot:12927380-Heterocapsa_arctica.AAC.1